MKQAVKVIYRQIGWMKCVACSDTRRFAGQMWLGKDKLGQDDFIVCPECKGSAQVPQYQVLDAETGVEIDYENLGRSRADKPEQEGLNHGS